MQKFDNNRIFMQDNSPIHTPKKVMDYLSRKKIELLTWCPYSPDCNPIENVWAYMTRDWPTLQNRTNAAMDEINKARWAKLRNEPGIKTRKKI